MKGLSDSRYLWQEWLSNLPPTSVDKVVAFGLPQKVWGNTRILSSLSPGTFLPHSTAYIWKSATVFIKDPLHFRPCYTLFHLILTVLWGSYDFKKGKLRLWEINSQSHKVSTKLVCNTGSWDSEASSHNAVFSLRARTSIPGGLEPQWQRQIQPSFPLGWNQSLQPLS